MFDLIFKSYSKISITLSQLNKLLDIKELNHLRVSPISDTGNKCTIILKTQRYGTIILQNRQSQFPGSITLEYVDILVYLNPSGNINFDIL